MTLFLPQSANVAPLLPFRPSIMTQICHELTALCRSVGRVRLSGSNSPLWELSVSSAERIINQSLGQMAPAASEAAFERLLGFLRMAAAWEPTGSPAERPDEMLDSDEKERDRAICRLLTNVWKRSTELCSIPLHWSHWVSWCWWGALSGDVRSIASDCLPTKLMYMSASHSLLTAHQSLMPMDGANRYKVDSKLEYLYRWD